LKKLIIAGTGIKFLSHLTIEVKSAIETSSCVVFLLNEPAMKNWVAKNAKKHVSMDNIYFSSKFRLETYGKIVDEIFRNVQEHDDICFLTYGHPTFFSSVAEEITKRVSFEKVLIQIMPGISAMDCLFSDLRIDPGKTGLQSYDATEFIIYDELFSITSHLVLWQIAIIGEMGIINNGEINLSCQKKAITILISKLMTHYPADHKVTLYVASQYPSVEFELLSIELQELNIINIPRLATLYIPPLKEKTMNLNIINQLKLDSYISN
jgi:uncharacterized protein YabN with tetrapyrrole methylase and pyrophosphatase domain